MSVISILVITVFAVIATLYVLFFRPKERLERKKRAEQKLEQQKELDDRIERVRKEWLGKEVRYHWDRGIIDDEGNIIEEFLYENRCCRHLSIHKESDHPSYVPIRISDVTDIKYNDDRNIFVSFECIIDREYLFEIQYVGCADAIASNPKLGDLYLSKKKYKEFEVGKVLTVKFRLGGDTDYPYLFPEII
ncbi:hypothetical protein FACS1894176_01100 [Bacteroidia bacterium]|nr:hypothetical protein FACS189428_3960 [Clostridia bacterium]GHV24534.1 hypothetical protein FACS1894176_01100 [Bacteroidia bacterium]